MNSKDRLYNCLWLSAVLRSPGVGRKQLIDLMRDFSCLDDLVGFFRSSHNKEAEVEKQLVLAGSKQINAVSWLDEGYPLRLRQISGFPLVIYWRGIDPVRMQDNAWLTVIGTRRASAYGRSVTRSVVTAAVTRQVVIVSGMARGIDSEAHRIALECGGRTVAVLGNGPDIIYPPENGELYDRIIMNGAVISEHPPGVPPRRQHFPARNRILSGLSDCVAVMEASEASGTMITAGFAADQGREVFAVPGNIFSGNSSGCNQLIRDGAGILLNPDDLFAHLPPAGNRLAPEEVRPCRPDTPSGQQLPPELQRLLAGGEMSLGQLAKELEMPLPQAAALLTGLEMTGLVIYERGRYALTDAGISCI